jgi:hypothetical protein
VDLSIDGGATWETVFHQAGEDARVRGRKCCCRRRPVSRTCGCGFTTARRPSSERHAAGHLGQDRRSVTATDCGGNRAPLIGGPM